MTLESTLREVVSNYMPLLDSQRSREESAFSSFASALLEHLSNDEKAPKLTPVL